MKPLGKKIQLDIQPIKIGAIQTDTVPESAKILAVGPDVSDVFKVGDTLVFKAWSVDVYTEGEDKFYFISSESDAILAIKD